MSKNVILQLINEKCEVEAHVEELEGRLDDFKARNDELLELIGIYKKEAADREHINNEKCETRKMWLVVVVVTSGNSFPL